MSIVYRMYGLALTRNTRTNAINYSRMRWTTFLMKFICLVFFLAVSLYACRHVWRFEDNIFYISVFLMVTCGLIYMAHIYREGNESMSRGTPLHKRYDELRVRVERHPNLIFGAKVVLLLVVFGGLMVSIHKVEALRVQDKFVRMSLVVFLGLFLFGSLIHMYVSRSSKG